MTNTDAYPTNRRSTKYMLARASTACCTVDVVPSLATGCAESCVAMADELVLPNVVEWDAPEVVNMDGEVAVKTTGPAGVPAAGPVAHATPGWGKH